MSDRFVVLSGCSGGGKSTLLSELAHRGFATVDEPGRRVVKAELASGGNALPWTDLAAFSRKAVELALADRAAANGGSDWVFFDRSLVDAASALEHATKAPTVGQLGRLHRYYPQVFLAPPWREIFHADAERRHGFADAVAEYERLERDYRNLGYEVVVLHKASVAARADAVLARLGQ